MTNTTSRLAVLALPAAALGALFAVAGCAPSAGPDGPPPPVDGAPPVNPTGGGQVASGYQEMEVSNGGTITGTVTYTGGSFAAPELPFTKDAGPDLCGGDKAPDPKLTVDAASKGVASVVVYLYKVSTGKKWGDGATIDNTGCMFSPYVTLHPYTKAMNIKNSDPVTHNTNLTKSKNDGINPLLDQGATKEWTVSKAEKRPFRVGCDVHGWMEAWVWVVDSPYYVLSGKNGGYSIGDVPAGEYQIRAWHALKGEITKGPKLTVGAGGSASANLEMAADGTITFK